MVFATGTPVSNSMTELYTVMRYLQYSTLQQKQLTHFDCWASTFGETTTAIELAPEGTGYRARTRFAKFFNLPELMNMFKEVADIKTSDQLHLPVPEATFETVVAKPSELQKEMVQNLSERAARVHSRHRGCIRGQYVVHHKRRPEIDRAGCAPDESHAAGRPEQQAERLCAERVAGTGGGQRPEADPAFVL